MNANVTSHIRVMSLYNQMHYILMYDSINQNQTCKGAGFHNPCGFVTDL